jgi:hypothetical protein
MYLVRDGRRRTCCQTGPDLGGGDLGSSLPYVSLEGGRLHRGAHRNVRGHNLPCQQSKLVLDSLEAPYGSAKLPALLGMPDRKFQDTIEGTRHKQCPRQCSPEPNHLRI